jgi:hypothetical protein
VVQRALIGAADVHAGLFPDRFQALQLAEFRGVIAAFAHPRIELHLLVSTLVRRRLFLICHKLIRIAGNGLDSQQGMRFFLSKKGLFLSSLPGFFRAGKTRVRAFSAGFSGMRERAGGEVPFQGGGMLARDSFVIRPVLLRATRV